MGSADEVIADLGRAQHAVFLGAQALERGVSRKMLRTREAAGRLDRLDPDLYHIAGTPVTWEARVLGHALAAGPSALVSHRAAAALWGFEGFARGTPEVTVPRGVRFRRAGVRVHESTDLDRCGRRIRSGIPVTDPARTLLDLARRTPDASLLQAIESARRLKLASWQELVATLAKHARPGRPGIRRLRRVIAANVGRDEVTDSTFELLVLALLAEHGLPEPVLHHRVTDVAGRFLAEVDLAYPELRIAIELDGGVHQRRDVFEADRPRQNSVVLNGWMILRFTWDALVSDPSSIVTSIRGAIELATARP